MTIITSGVVASRSSEAQISPMQNKILSRHRRFFVPQTSGWTFKLEFSALIPLEALGPTGPLVIGFPLVYSVDTGT